MKVDALPRAICFRGCLRAHTMSYKLFIPGPIAVSEKTLRAMAQPMIGHRSTDFVALYQSIQPDLQALVYSQYPVYLSTSSAFVSMAGAIRYHVQQKVSCCLICVS